MRAQMVRLFERVAPGARAIAQAGAPVRTGRLRAAISARVYPKQLRLRVGLLTKGDRRRFFYGYILEVGRKAQTVRARRRTGGGVTSYAYRVSPISAGRYDMVQGRARRSIRALIYNPANELFDRALRKLAGLPDV